MMIILHIASMPSFPRVSRKSCPMGRGRSEPSKSETEEVAKDAIRTSFKTSPQSAAKNMNLKSEAAILGKP
jgi:hypothetical protein